MSIVEPSTGIIVVTSSSNSANAINMLNEHACRDWASTNLIVSITIDDNYICNVLYITKQINNFIQKNRNYFEVFIYGVDNTYTHKFKKNRKWNVSFCSEFSKTFEERLKKQLRAYRKDWFSDTADRLKNSWLRHSISEDHIIAWLKQFENLGKRTIGKKLLQSLDFWPESLIIGKLDINETSLCSFDKLCLFNDQPGKSADILANLVHKRLDEISSTTFNLEICTPKQCIDTNQPSQIIWLEDSLLTATESSSLLNALMGKTISGRKPKTSPLSDINNMRNKRIQFRFAIATDYGVKNLEACLSELNIDNYDIKHGSLLSLLTAEGEKAILNDTFYSDKSLRIIRSPDAFFKRPAFISNIYWNDQSRSEAVNFCKSVGYQLFKEYIDNMCTNGGWNKWDNRKLSQSALGMHGCGLALALAHTVPKATLPLFWGSGQVSYKSYKTEWSPLFPP